MSTARETHVYKAKLSEQAERYEALKPDNYDTCDVAEMVESMKSVAKLDVDLTVEERNLLSVGYKNVIGARRASWRIMSSIEQKEESKGNENYVNLIKGYRCKVEEELAKICDDILSIIDKHLLPSSGSGEATVFYHKMKGDYFRYLAEFKTDEDRKEAAEQSLKGYEARSFLFTYRYSCFRSCKYRTSFDPPNPSWSGSQLLNLYLVLGVSACHLAKQAFDEAIAELDSLSEESYKDSTLIMQLLRDNLTLWTSDLPEEGAAGDEKLKNEGKPAEEEGEDDKDQESYLGESDSNEQESYLLSAYRYRLRIMKSDDEIQNSHIQVSCIEIAAEKGMVRKEVKNL
ncbi:hypothetical protein OSB04_021604 [Centaurea solstitialis]|uniref:14-3-3 domain-containing protein n=1 Tax=Centaurea solstitialis TaxID=347529 RepID=A0AA38T7W3_9ASTR|nr:hypothetical protein OSB04_021604 [Centaurea solstitialis]